MDKSWNYNIFYLTIYIQSTVNSGLWDHSTVILPPIIPVIVLGIVCPKDFMEESEAANKGNGDPE